jgi:hypothetical protein
MGERGDAHALLGLFRRLKLVMGVYYTVFNADITRLLGVSFGDWFLCNGSEILGIRRE